MDPLPTFLFLLVAVVCFVAAAVGVVVRRDRPFDLVALGLACAFFPTLWAAAAAID